jgi:hypothetical protein
MLTGQFDERTKETSYEECAPVPFARLNRDFMKKGRKSRHGF